MLSLVERLKNEIQFLADNTYTPVANDEDKSQLRCCVLPIRRTHIEIDATVRRELDGVGQQIDQYLT